MKSKANNAWVFVRVERGFPTGISLFRRKRDAESAQRKFVSTMNPDYDECDVFLADLGDFNAKGKLTVEA